jgi:hypothetical protein
MPASQGSAVPGTVTEDVAAAATPLPTIRAAAIAVSNVSASLLICLFLLLWLVERGPYLVRQGIRLVLLATTIEKASRPLPDPAPREPPFARLPQLDHNPRAPERKGHRRNPLFCSQLCAPSIGKRFLCGSGFGVVEPGLEQPAVYGVARRLGTRGNPQLTVDRTQVRVHGAAADEELLGHPDVSLPGSQPGELRWRRDGFGL